MERIRNDVLEELLLVPRPLWHVMISSSKERKDAAERAASWEEAQRHEKPVAGLGSVSLEGRAPGKGRQNIDGKVADRLRCCFP